MKITTSLNPAKKSENTIFPHTEGVVDIKAGTITRDPGAMLGDFLNCARCVFSIFFCCQIFARSLPDRCQIGGTPVPDLFFVPDF